MGPARRRYRAAQCRGAPQRQQIDRMSPRTTGCPAEDGTPGCRTTRLRAAPPEPPCRCGRGSSHRPHPLVRDRQARVRGIPGGLQRPPNLQLDAGFLSGEGFPLRQPHDAARHGGLRIGGAGRCHVKSGHPGGRIARVRNLPTTDGRFPAFVRYDTEAASPYVRRFTSSGPLRRPIRGGLRRTFARTMTQAPASGCWEARPPAPVIRAIPADMA